MLSDEHISYESIRLKFIVNFRLQNKNGRLTNFREFSHGNYFAAYFKHRVLLENCILYLTFSRIRLNQDDEQ